MPHPSRLGDQSTRFHAQQLCALYTNTLHLITAPRASLPQSGYPSSSASIKGTIKVAGQAIGNEKMRAISGFVHQEDVIMDTMTVREALTFSAMLRLAQGMDKQAKVRVWCRQRAMRVLPAARKLLLLGCWLHKLQRWHGSLVCNMLVHACTKRACATFTQPTPW
jgi:hypothetical protein